MNTALASSSETPHGYELLERVVAGDLVPGWVIVDSLGREIRARKLVSKFSVVNLLRDNPAVTRNDIFELKRLLREAIDALQLESSLRHSYTSALKAAEQLLL